MTEKKDTYILMELNITDDDQPYMRYLGKSTSLEKLQKQMRAELEYQVSVYSSGMGMDAKLVFMELSNDRQLLIGNNKAFVQFPGYSYDWELFNIKGCS